MAEKKYTFKEMADQFGVSEEEFISTCKREGLLDENGYPTQLALDEGIFVIEPEICKN